MRTFFLVMALFSSALVIIAYIRYRAASGESRRKDTDEIETLRVALEDLSPVWAAKKFVVNLEKIAKTWKPDLVVDEGLEEEIEKPQYKNADTKEFYGKYVADNVYLAGTVRKVVLELLKILDEEGDCPSVVNIYGDSEYKLLESEKGSYDILAKTTLRRHSFDVVVEMLKLLREVPVLTAKGTVAALAHDIGKIESQRDKLQTIGDHPFISLTVLEKVPGFNDLSYRDQILKAVREHHRMPKDDIVAEKLREADVAARQRELSDNLSAAAALPLKAEASPESVDKSKTEKPAKKGGKAGKGNGKAASTALSDLVGIGDPGTTKVVSAPVFTKLDWFDSKEVLSRLEPLINIMQGGRWSVFSMGNGYVYFQMDAFWNVLKQCASEKGEVGIVLGDTDREYRTNILFSSVRTLIEEGGIIADEFIRDGMYGSRFDLKMDDNKLVDNRFYVPFKAEAFATGIGKLEARKYGRVSKIVSVIPRVRA